MLLAVGCKMLYAGAHIPALDTLHQAGRHFPGQIRILAHVFEVPAAQGGSLDIDRRAQIDGYPLVLALIPQGLAHPADQASVKG